MSDIIYSKGMPFVYVMNTYRAGSERAKSVINHAGTGLYKIINTDRQKGADVVAVFKYPIPGGRETVPRHLRVLTDAEVEKVFGKDK